MLKHILGQQKPFGRMQPFRVVFTYSISRVTPGAIHIIALQANGVKTLRAHKMEFPRNSLFEVSPITYRLFIYHHQLCCFNIFGTCR